jgi:hypothetical protein
MDEQLAALYRRRNNCICHFIRLSIKLDEIEQSPCPQMIELLQIKNRLERYDMEFCAVQNEIVDLNEKEIGIGFEMAEDYEQLQLRVMNQLQNIRLGKTSKRTNGESAAGPKSTPHYDFSPTIDQHDPTPYPQFNYRSVNIGKAARTTEYKYHITENVLRGKFNCRPQICTRYWHTLLYYPKMAKETCEGIEDLIETFQLNLEALKELGEPLTSITVIYDLIISKLPRSTIRRWRHTIPSNYIHLINFLKTRTRDDQTNAPGGHTCASTHRVLYL